MTKSMRWAVLFVGTAFALNLGGCGPVSEVIQAVLGGILPA